MDKPSNNTPQSEKSYKNLLLKMGETFSIKQAYVVLESVFAQANAYFDTWKSYQALWDIEQEKVF